MTTSQTMPPTPPQTPPQTPPPTPPPTPKSAEELEKHTFSADLNNLLSLIINTFYSDKSIFLRELISNSSDAIGKIRHESLLDPSVLKDGDEFKIEIIPDIDNKTLIIKDNGIGMTKEDLINNLGTIARSGTKEFVEKIQKTGDLSLVGQFGCGFYSSFLVADKVQAISKHNSSAHSYEWCSDASGSYTIKQLSETRDRGTEIILHIKDDQSQFLRSDVIGSVINTHSRYTNYPILLLVEKEEEEEVTDNDDDKPSTEEEDDNVKDSTKEDDDKPSTKEDDDKPSTKEDDDKPSTKEDDDKPSTKEDDDKPSDEPKIEEVKEKKTKKVKKIVKKLQHINNSLPIWKKPVCENTEDDYKNFYKTFTGEWDEPLGVRQFAIEGQLEFKGILYLPPKAPVDLFETATGKKRNNIHLYVKQVFVSDTVDELVPEWLRFIKGVVDSEDLPLNISREMLQQNKVVKIMSKQIIKKSFELFDELRKENPDRYVKFYNNFAKSLKLGIHESSTYRQKLSKYLMYFSTKSGGKQTTFDEYISRTKEDQKNIYFITGDNNIINSPFLEQFRKRDIEVLFMNEPMDEYCVQQLSEVDGKKLVCITKGDIKFDEEDLSEEIVEKHKDLCELSKGFLEERVDRVILSNKLVNFPCIISTSEFGWSAGMEKIMNLQALRDNSLNSYMTAKRTLELNPDHNIVKYMNTLTGKTEDREIMKDLLMMLYQTGLMVSGFDIEAPTVFATRIHRIIEMGLHARDMEEQQPQKEVQIPVDLSYKAPAEVADAGRAGGVGRADAAGAPAEVAGAADAAGAPAEVAAGVAAAAGQSRL